MSGSQDGYVRELERKAREEPSDEALLRFARAYIRLNPPPSEPRPMTYGDQHAGMLNFRDPVTSMKDLPQDGKPGDFCLVEDTLSGFIYLGWTKFHGPRVGQVKFPKRAVYPGGNPV